MLGGRQDSLPMRGEWVAGVYGGANYPRDWLTLKKLFIALQLNVVIGGWC